ncbi:MAG: helix-turn-helix domain-containing protein [Gammaproteobacteria bacterium]|nr:MAG: helix-turn-helix domain-containing protein [Gammaproteobacteria bacterium]
MEILAGKLKKLRESEGKSVQWLANQIGVSRHAIYKWERGKCKPDYEHLVKITDIFNISVEDFFYDAGSSKSPDESVLTTVEVKHRLDNAVSFAHIRNCISEYTKQLGIDNFFYMQKFRGDVGKEPFVTTLTDIDQTWIKIYSDSGFAKIDPTWDYCLNNVAPAFSSDLVGMARDNNDKQALNFYSTLAEHVAQYFAIIPIHGGCCLGALIISVSKSSPEKKRRVAAALDTMALVGHYLYAAVHSVQERLGGHSTSVLSKREIDTIALLAEGNSVDSIAEKLFISKAAIFARIDRAKAKLDAKSREQLVLIAAAKNLLPHNMAGMKTKSKKS